MQQHDTVFFKIGDIKYETSIAFDLDNTLIVTNSGKKFAINYEDYKWINLDILQKLKHNIMIFTNQAKMPSDFFNKLALLERDLNNNFSIFISTHHDEYRKPHIGMYELYNKIVKIPIIKYVGDAAGRNSDFSSCDRYFAYNAKIPFELPEDFYKITHNPIFKHSFYDIPQNIEITPKINHNDAHFVILTCGLPASGKSTYIKQLNIPIISQDMLGTKIKTIKEVKTLIENKTSFVIDKLFCTLTERLEYLALFPPEYKKICYDFTDYDKDGKLTKSYIFRCKHFNEYRAFVEKSSKLIPEIVYNVQSKNFIPPNLEFNEIHMIKNTLPFVGHYIDE